MFKLIIEDDEGKTTVVPLIRDEITIGRKEGNTIRLTERNVSRRHARLFRQNGTVLIEDLQSYNGIRINGDRISGRAPIAEGDRVQIGDYQLALKLDKTAAAPVDARAEEKTVPFYKDGEVTRATDDVPTVPQPVVQGNVEVTAKLAVVSSNFAGREFLLDKAAVVIGRTDENDVVINHRSISRHHAKVIREAGHFHIVDLQSANGVRVNGEEYGKVELRKGDHIDLGHVRLRFIAPGEDFVFERDAKIVEVGGERRGSSMGMMAIAAVAVVLVGLGGYVLVRSMGGKPAGDTHASGDVDVQVAKLSVEVDRAMKVLDWDTAIAKCEQGLRIDPNQETLRDKRTKAESERKNQATFAEFQRAVTEHDNDGAVTRFQELAEDSIYRERAQESYAQVKRAYIGEHLGRAKGVLGASHCEEARKHVEAVLLVDEGNTDAQEIAKEIARRCGGNTRKVATASPPPAKPPRERPTPTQASRSTTQGSEELGQLPPEPRESPHVKPASAATESGACDADRFIATGMDEYVHGNYAAATESAHKALKCSPGNPKAWRIIGASACFQKNRDEAVHAWNKLGTMDRQFIKYVCDRSQIKIP